MSSHYTNGDQLSLSALAGSIPPGSQISQVGAWGKDIGVFTMSVPNVTIRAHSVKVWKFLPETLVGRREDL